MELKAQKISKTYHGITILEDISFSLEVGQKVGLIGSNGTGKTTLLKILAGIVEPDSGTVQLRKGAVLGYMPQDTSIVSDESIREYIRRVTGIGELENQMAKSVEAQNEYERRNGYAFDYRTDIVLAGFGLGQISANRSINSLSSGQKSKVFMAGVLLSDPDILLLDEPTNNLDLPALIWLEGFIAQSDITCIVVSHDRLFLDRVVSKIFEIDFYTRKLNITSGRYSDYLQRKEKEFIRQMNEYLSQQEEIERLTKSAQDKKAASLRGSRYGGTDNDKFLRGFKRDRAAGSGKAAKAIEKRIEQMEVVDKPIEKEVLRIFIEPTEVKGSRDIVVKDLVAGRDDFRVGPVSFSISYGNRVAILGLNGAGKTTLLKTITGDIPAIAGSVSIGGSLVLGNLMQEHDNLPREKSLKEFLVERAGVSIQDAYALCAKFGFKEAEIDKGIGNLSPGGRARLLFALFTALSVNCLILDEPTNHLDLEALNALEEMVSKYEGTIVLVSHDRYFLDKFKATDIFVIKDGKLEVRPSFDSYRIEVEKEAKRLAKLI